MDVIIIGAGAAGLMAASRAASLGKKVLVLDHAGKIGEKIRISGGGRCNFTNIGASTANYISENPHFAISALKNFSAYDFIKLIESYNISYHEKKLGQLFCDNSSQQIIDMLIDQCNRYSVKINLNTQIIDVTKNDDFMVTTTQDIFTSKSLIIATGGLSIPKIGSSNFAYLTAQKFGINIVPTRPGLVPLTLSDNELEFAKSLSGISIDAEVMFGKISFRENILFTHRGISGPAILQISSYIKEYPATLKTNLLPYHDLKIIFKEQKNSKSNIATLLKNYLPNRFVEVLSIQKNLSFRLTDCKFSYLEEIADLIHNFRLNITGNEGYLKAEVTVGGVDTYEISSKTMETKKVNGLYFIGESLDVTGWLGGYNFQWAWSSGYASGGNIS